LIRKNLRAAIWMALAAAAMLTHGKLTAQETGSVNQSKPATIASVTPCGPQAPIETPARLAPDRQMKTDWPWLGRYKKDDLDLGSPKPGEARVVFMGASITERWKLKGPRGSFPGKSYINRGISGQTSPQMLLRFRQDVIDLQPKAVVILIGTNDVAGLTGPITAAQTEENVESMADLASANNIRVVLCAMLPSSYIPWKPDTDPVPKIAALNQWFKAYAARKGYVYVDYYSAMKDAQGGLSRALSEDGVHPTALGYAIMAPLVEIGIRKALEQRPEPAHLSGSVAP